ncbi:hypothetical protein BASA50_007849 [Batrachochytrium salamandrivorans]|uniref:HYDIN/VesB/CFA65-like Ig-like domain-containing protein n=1 Tax=Batrachochytrium salamandrivorans TaxID=1357716 RepID=A0ABQ8F5V4_9FUNG|nr:hypothetical protein BASA50_007849 [Batrachochytrium salamandrivorans]
MQQCSLSRTACPGNLHLLKSLRDAGKVLATDYSFSRSFEYENSWTLLINTLESLEPFLRMFALKTLEMSSSGFRRTIAAISSNAHTRLVVILIDLVSGAERWQERCLAARILGAASSTMNAPKFPSSIRCLAFQAVQEQFLSLFPADFESHSSTDGIDYFDIRTTVSPMIFESRIVYIHAISRFFSAPEARTLQFMDYIDRLFQAILNPTSHQLLVAAVVQALATQLPVTNRNRIRVECFYRHRILEFLSEGTCNDQLSGEKINGSRCQSRLLSTDDTSQSKSRPLSSRDDCILHPHLLRMIDTFLSVWYLRSPNPNVIPENSTMDSLLHFDVGYTHRKGEVLQWHSSTRGKSLTSVRQGSIQMSTPDSICILPYPKNLDAKVSTLFFSNKPYPDPPSLGSISLRKIKSKIADSDIELPKVPTLTLNLKPAILEFKLSPYQIDLFLENISVQHESSFHIQVHPHQFFSVTPAFGTVRQGKSIPLKIKFTPRPYDVLQSNKVHGFLMIRDMNGLPIERVQLSAYNTPSIKVIPPIIDFGMCPKGQSRSLSFIVVNLLPIECPVIMVINQETSSGAFHLPYTQIILAPFERKSVSVRYNGNADLGLVEDELMLLSFGSFTTFISLRVVGSVALCVLEQKLDFGPTDIYFSSVQKKLNLLNLDTIRSLVVTFTTSTHELIVNHNEEVVLAPGEQRSVIVDFKSAMSGARHERIIVQTSNTPLINVNVTAFSGPNIVVPVFENMYFPFTFVGNPVSVKFPITNLGLVTSQIQVYVAAGYPISFRVMKSDYSNRRLNTPNVIVEGIPYQTNEHHGILLTLSHQMTITIEIEFKHQISGEFMVPLFTRTVKPKDVDICTHNMHFVVTDNEFLSLPKSLSSLRQFIQTPYGQIPTPLEQFGAPTVQADAESPTPRISNTSQTLKFQEEVQIVSGSLSRSRDSATLDYVTLVNLTNSPQQYHIVLSLYFVTTIPLEGEISANSTVYIPIRVDPLLYLTPETKEFIAFGSISVINSNFNLTGFASTQLHGVVNNPIWMEFRKDVPAIKFPRCRVMETLTRTFVIRNKSYTNVVWEGSISEVDDPISENIAGYINSNNLKESSTSAPGIWIPFDLTMTKITLKPFEYCTIDVTIASAKEGDFLCLLKSTYMDSDETIDSDIQNGLLTSYKKHPIGSWLLECSVGLPDITVVPNCLDFGDVAVSDKAEKTVVLLNSLPLSAQFSIGNSKAVLPVKTKIKISPKSQMDLPIIFSPQHLSVFSELLSFSVGDTTHVINALGCSGHFSVDSNLARPHIVESMCRQDAMAPIAGSIIDFGFVNTHKPKTKTFTIQNTGTLDLIVLGITPSNKRRVSWTPLCDYFDHTTTNSMATKFGKGAIDDLECNLDEHILCEGRFELPVCCASDTVFNNTDLEINGLLTKKQDKDQKKPNWDALFPLRIPPFQSFSVSLVLCSKEKGDYISPLYLDIERSSKKVHTAVWWTKGSFQPPLIPLEKKLDFGIRPVNKQHKSHIKFTNTGTKPIRWKLLYDDIKYSPVLKYDPPPLPLCTDVIPNPISIFPESGKLNPGNTQTIDVVLTPNLAQYDLYSQLRLLSEDYAECLVDVQATGASSKLVVECTILDFGVIRVGTQKMLKIRLCNRGILQVNYFVETSHSQFQTDPEQGVLDGDTSTDVLVKFMPKSAGNVNAHLKILQSSNESLEKPPVLVLLSGIGSYPELVVLTRSIDYATALFKNPNRRIVKVQNKGSAEANLVFNCSHPDISLELNGQSSLVIGPHEAKDIYVVYTPQIIERLDTKAFIRSSDSRGDSFMIMLKGNVGIPRLVITPLDALESLDFGVMKLNKTYQKTFIISNNGNIFLNYSAQLVPLSHCQVYDDFDKDSISPFSQQNIPMPIIIEPSTGTLEIGKEISMTVKFTPTMLVKYEYQLLLGCDFQNFKGTIYGTGGCAMLKIDSPLKKIDFGISRLNRTYVKTVSFSNKGNIAFNYHVRPEPDDGDWSKYDADLARLRLIESRSRPETAASGGSAITLSGAESTLGINTLFWLNDLTSKGIRIINPDGNCAPRTKVNLIIEFEPKMTTPVLKPMRIYFGDHFESFEVSGYGASPQLHLRDLDGAHLDTANSTPLISIGVHPVNSVYTHFLEIVNDGPFGVDFLIQPSSSSEFDVYPLRGFIEAHSSIPLKVFFQPNSENIFHTNLKVLWEGKSLNVKIQGHGGVGRLEVVYTDSRDLLLKSIDFGMVPFNTACEKRLVLQNVGLVGVSALLEVENDEYNILQLGDHFPISELLKPRSTAKGMIITWHSSIKLYLPPARAVDIGIRFLARSVTTSVGNITVRSDSCNLMVSLKGKGGTISLSHRGDLDFGDISCNYTYTRKITLINSGSIPSQLSAEWLVVGHSTEHSSPHVTLAATYTPLDPRSGWAKEHYFRQLGIVGESRPLTPKENWGLVALMVRKSSAKEIEMMRSTMMSVVNSIAGTSSGKNLIPTAASTRLGIMMTSVSAQSGRRGAAPAFSMHFKRRQMFYHLITSTQLTSQSSPCHKPFVKVDPAISALQSYGETILTVELHLGGEDTFLATLLVKSDVPNTPIYEIPLTATPKIVNIICNDTRMLNFYRQPLGETEYITREITNVGHKDIGFNFLNSNAGLTIVPSKGTLKIGQTLSITFGFKPVNESIQSADVIFEPTCSQPIRFKMYGGGGYVKASLARYRRFDFGHCMIGKDTVSYLPITNEGNAILHLSYFEVVGATTFFQGRDWPQERVSLFPGESYNLPLVFNPHEESPAPGKLIIRSSTESYEIELIGLGREAVLIVSKVALEFSECLIGNSYEQRLGLKNIGDVNYPATFQLEKEFPDLEFYPPSLIIDPFSESFVVISYTPSHEVRTAIVFSISSPYSTHKVPVMVHAGVATLEFSSMDLDFGMFEKTTRPSLELVIKNTGTVRTSYQIQDTVKPSMFSIVPAKGMLAAGKSANLSVTHIRHEVAELNEKLNVKTDLIDKNYYITAHGQCEETVLHPDEFSLINLGICPILEPTTKQLMFKNHGRFPLEYSIKAAYPLKVIPAQGCVLGLETGTVNIQWNPSGGYELRTQLSMVTNIGKYQIVVRGKAILPEIHVSNMYLDYGICAVGFQYRNAFIVENKGKAPVHFSIPSCKDPSFSTEISGGVLGPKEMIEIEVCFKPSYMGKVTSSFMVECKGVHYKEIVVVGVGGSMDVVISPNSINIGRCPYNLKIYEHITITNNGDVTLHVDFSKTKPLQGLCEIVAPAPVIIGPWQSTKCAVGVLTSAIGYFTAQLLFDTKEQSFSIPMSGVGIKIALTGRSKEILENENIYSIKQIHPFHVEREASFLSLLLKRYSKPFILDSTIVQRLSQLYCAYQNIDTGQPQTITALVETPVQHGNAAAMDLLEDPVPDQYPVVLQHELHDVKIDQTLQSNVLPREEIIQTETLSGSSLLENETDSLYNESNQAEAIQAISDLPPLPASETIPSKLIEEYAHASNCILQESADGDAVEQVPCETEYIDANPVLNLGEDTVNDLMTLGSTTSTATADMEQRYQLLKALDRISTSMEPAAITEVDAAFEEVLELDVDPILTGLEPSVVVDLKILLDRQPPFGRHEEPIGTVLHGYEKHPEYISVFPSLIRKARNANTGPFTDWKEGILYGRGVELFPPRHN